MNATDHPPTPTKRHIMTQWNLNQTSPPFAPIITRIKIDSLDIWDTPIEGVFKLNFHGVFKGNPGNLGFRVAIRNHASDILWTFFGNINYERNNIEKLEGLVEGVSIASRNNLLPLIEEGDLQVIVSLATKIHHGY